MEGSTDGIWESVDRDGSPHCTAVWGKEWRQWAVEAAGLL